MMIGAHVLHKARPFCISFMAALAGAYVGARFAAPEPLQSRIVTRPASLAEAAHQSGVGDLAIDARFAAVPVRATLDAQERSAIAEAVARLMASSAAPNARAPVEPPRPSPVAVQARRDAEQILDSALSAGVWNEEDAIALRRVLPKLAEQDLDSVILAVTRALNEGQLAVGTHGPPF
jgi:hypothetical protein